MNDLKSPLLAGSGAGTGIAMPPQRGASAAFEGGAGGAPPARGPPARGPPTEKTMVQKILGHDPQDSPIDDGFETHVEFPRGHVDVREGAATLDLSSLQAPLTFGQRLCAGLGVILTLGTGIGIPYVLSKLTLVRRGEIGMTEWINGRCRVLGAGWHLVETMNTSVKKASLNRDFISHGSLKIIRVLPGNVGLAFINGNPVLLTPGLHLTTDPLFEYERQESMATQHISIGTVHLITVQKQEVGLALVDSTAHFLEPGIHLIAHPRFTFKGFKSSTEEHINVGCKHRIRVPAGRVGLAWDAGEPLLLEAGRVYNIDKNAFSYVGSKAVTDNVIVHGRLRIITVREGSWGVSYNDGALEILPPGRHSLTKATHYLSGFMTGALQVLQIPQVTSMTSDNVPIAFDAAISVRVADPVLAVTRLCGTEGVFDPAAMMGAIISSAKMVLGAAIGNNHLNASFSATTKRPAPAGAASRPAAVDLLDDPTPSAADAANSESFRQTVHDSFMAAFEAKMAQCGIQVVDMSMEDVRITAPELAAALSQGAVAKTKLVSAQIQMEVVKAQATAEQAAELMRAEAQAKSIAILAKAEADRIRLLDEAIAHTSGVTRQRELIRASGDILKEAKSTIVFAQSAADVANVLGAGRAGMAGLLQEAGK